MVFETTIAAYFQSAPYIQQQQHKYSSGLNDKNVATHTYFHHLRFPEYACTSRKTILRLNAGLESSSVSRCLCSCHLASWKSFIPSKVQKQEDRRGNAVFGRVASGSSSTAEPVEYGNERLQSSEYNIVQKAAGQLKTDWRHFLSINNLVVHDYFHLVKEVNSLESQVRRLTNEQLRATTDCLRKRLKQEESISEIQAEAFAVVREAARRVLGMRHFDVQIVGGAVLHDGGIAEMKTGEGKTLVSSLAAYLNALTGEGVHVVTVNDYLAKRDAEWMGQIHRFLGLSVGLIQSGMTSEERKAAYACDITYSNNSELGFDYLRDHIGTVKKEDLVMRWPKTFNFAIVDEVDSVLIDEGRNPLIISSQSSKDAARYPVAAKVAEFLVVDYHYKLDLKEKSVELTEEGVAAAELALDAEDLWDDKDPWARFVLTALKAKEFYQRDVDYIVKDGQAQIVDEFTGRVVENRRWSEGIHQAVEAKEGLNIQENSVVVAQITYQSFFKLYPKLSGMTGTAKTEEAEFLKMFKMPVVAVPTNLPNIRQDYCLQVYATTGAKWNAVRKEVEEMYIRGRPVLVGTTSVEQSEYLSALLQEWNIPHNVLNARPKYAAREAEIVAQAGRKCAITIATNMAGRGTDIILGGNPEMLAKEIVEGNMLSFMTQEAPNIDTDGAPLSQMAFSKIKLTASSLAKLAKASLTARFVCGKGGAIWSYREAKSKLASALELCQSEDEKKLQDLSSGHGVQMITLGPAIAVAYLSILKDCEIHCKKEGNEVKQLGGLHVLGTALHESRRIDNQLRGRAGRQGDPGSTRFMISLQDEMIRKFDSEWAVNLVSKAFDDSPLESKAFQQQINSLQMTVESYFMKIRESLIEYDDVIEVQRRHVYNLREAFLMDDPHSFRHRLHQYMQAVADEIILQHIDPSKAPRSWNIDNVLAEFEDVAVKHLKASNVSTDIFSEVTGSSIVQSLKTYQEAPSTKLELSVLPGLPIPGTEYHGLRRKASSVRRWLEISFDQSARQGKYLKEVQLFRKYLGDLLIGLYELKIESSGFSILEIDQIERMMAIKALDGLWSAHLANLNRLRAAVNIRGFAHMNPLEEYKIDSCRFFIAMLSAGRRLTVEYLLKPWLIQEGDELDVEYA